MPPPPAPLDDADAREKLEVQKRKLETPLAAMLPSKYADVDVTELFPDFRPDKVLRFSRLFGPGKPSSLPQIWRSVRKKRKRRRHKDSAGQHDSESASDDEKHKLKHRGWTFNYGPMPSADQIASDDEDKLLRKVKNYVQWNKINIRVCLFVELF